MDTEVPRSCGGRLSLEFLLFFTSEKHNPEGEFFVNVWWIGVHLVSFLFFFS